MTTLLPPNLARPLTARGVSTAPGQRIRSVGILGTGAAVPSRVLDNRELEQLVETSDEWILARTGIRERRIVAPGQATSDLAAQAARTALERAGRRAEEVELIVVATVTPDHPCPPTACLVQHKLGATRAAGFDLSAACSGFVNALLTGRQLIASGAFENALVIGSDVLSSMTDYEDRATCILFGDGAGAVFLAANPAEGRVADVTVGIDGSGADLIRVPAGGSARPACRETVGRREHFLKLDGRKVFRFAVAKICELVHELADRNGLEVDQIDHFVLHQANLRILEAAANRLAIGPDRLTTNIERFGNTSSASIPIALDEALSSGRIQRGDKVAMVGFGGGLTWGAALLDW